MKPKLPAQFAGAEKNGVPYAVILGEDELAKGVVKVKELGLPEGHPEKDGVEVKLVELAQEVKKRIEKRGGDREKEIVEAVEKVKLEENTEV